MAISLSGCLFVSILSISSGPERIEPHYHTATVFLLFCSVALGELPQSSIQSCFGTGHRIQTKNKKKKSLHFPGKFDRKFSVPPFSVCWGNIFEIFSFGYTLKGQDRGTVKLIIFCRYKRAFFISDSWYRSC